MIYAKKPKWYELPLLCLLGIHDTRVHPGMWWWEVCVRCNGERSTAK
jgi:hypothetical protein